MSNDSDKFHTREELESRGFTREGNHFVRGDERWLPLYEAKLMHQFTHRWATYQPNGKTRSLTADELRDPHAVVMPRYWVHQADVLAKNNDDWFIGFRNTTNTTNERTVICSILPSSGVGNNLPILLMDSAPTLQACLVQNLCTWVFDYVARTKVGGQAMNFYLVKQFPVIPPHSYTSALLDFIRPRVLELTYTAWDLGAFARDLGYEGAPFVWDEARRFRLRCELDALYFHLYGMARGDVEYIMDTFPIVRRKDEAAYGEFRTKRVILEMYDAMARLPSMTVPAPKDAGSRYAVPDVSGWQTWLAPPPAHPPDFDHRGAEGAEER